MALVLGLNVCARGYNLVNYIFPTISFGRVQLVLALLTTQSFCLLFFIHQRTFFVVIVTLDEGIDDGGSVYGTFLRRSFSSPGIFDAGQSIQFAL